MKYAFIDYENINSLDYLNLTQYEKIFLFIGANQTSIRLAEKYTVPLNIVVITVDKIADNNLDFHIAYYLGKCDHSVDKMIQFDIISNDKGYLGICDYIHKLTTRHCQLIRPQDESKAQNTLESTNNQNKLESKENVKLSQSISDKIMERAFKSVIHFLTQSEERHLPKKKQTLYNYISSRINFVEITQDLKQHITNNIIELLKKEQWITIKNSQVVYLKK
ncbi:PIN domain-containing protein [Lonepinella koalarum]